jgi:hypothetical protein
VVDDLISSLGVTAAAAAAADDDDADADVDSSTNVGVVDDDSLLAELALIENAPVGRSKRANTTSAATRPRHGSTAGEAFFAEYRNKIGLPQDAAIDLASVGGAVLERDYVDDEFADEYADDAAGDDDEEYSYEDDDGDGQDDGDDDMDAGFGRIAEGDDVPMPGDVDDDDDDLGVVGGGGGTGEEDELLKQLESVEVHKLAAETMPDAEELEPRMLEVTCITRSRACRVGVKPQTTYVKLARSVRAALGTPGTTDDSADPFGVLVVLVSEDGAREEVIGGLGDVAVMTPHATDLQLSRQKLRYRLFWAPTSNIGAQLALPGAAAASKQSGNKTPPMSPTSERRPSNTGARESRLQQMMADVSKSESLERRAKNAAAVRESFHTTRKDGEFDRQVRLLEDRLASKQRTSRTEADRRIVAHEFAASALRRTASGDVDIKPAATPPPMLPPESARVSDRRDDTSTVASDPPQNEVPPLPIESPTSPKGSTRDKSKKKEKSSRSKKHSRPTSPRGDNTGDDILSGDEVVKSPRSPRGGGDEKKGAKNGRRAAAGMFDKRTVSWLPRGLVKQWSLAVQTPVAACLAAIGAPEALRGAPAVPIMRDNVHVGTLRSEHLIVYLFGIFPVKELVVAPAKTKDGVAELVPSAMFAAAAAAAGTRLTSEDAQVLAALGGEQAADAQASLVVLDDTLKAAMSSLGQRYVVPLDGLRTRAASEDVRGAVGIVTPNILLRVAYEYLKSSHSKPLAAQLRSVPLLTDADLVQVQWSTATIDVLTTMRAARASSVAVVHGTTIVGCFTVLHLSRLTPATLGALALPVIDFLAASDAELARCSDDAQLRPNPGLPRALPRAGLLLNIEVRDGDLSADSSVLFRSRLLLVPARWLVVELLRHIGRECAAVSDVAAWKAVVLPRNAVCNDNAKLQFYNISPDDLLRIVRRGGERVAVTAAAQAATANAPKAVAAAPPPLPPGIPLLTPSSTLADACSLLCRVPKGEVTPACDVVWIVDDVHHRRVLGALSTLTLLRYLVRGTQGALPATRRVVHSVIAPLAPLDPRGAPRRSTDAVVAAPAGGSAMSAAAASARQTPAQRQALLSRNKSVSVLSDKPSLEEMERQVHMKRKQSIRHILTRKKLDVVDRTVVAALYGADPATAMKRERAAPPSFVDRAIRYLEKHGVTVQHLFGERERELREVVAAREKLAKRDPDLPPPVPQGDVANLRAFAEKGAVTIDLDVTSSFTVAPATVAAALREYALELPEPLFTYALVPDALAIIDHKVGNKARTQALAELLVKVPKPYALLIRELLQLFGHVIAGGATGNAAGELAVQFACAFVRPRKPERAPEPGPRVPHPYEPVWVHSDSAWFVAGQEARREECAELIELLIDAREQLVELLPTVIDVENALGIVRGGGGEAASEAASTAEALSDGPSPRSNVDLGDSVLVGWLMKQSPAFHKSWQRRYFVLKSHYLFYSRSETEDPIGLLKIGPDTFVNLNPKNPLAFNIIAKDKVLHLAAKTKEDMEMWVDAIDVVIDELKEGGGNH